MTTLNIPLSEDALLWFNEQATISGYVSAVDFVTDFLENHANRRQKTDSTSAILDIELSDDEPITPEIIDLIGSLVQDNDASRESETPIFDSLIKMVPPNDEDNDKELYRQYIMEKYG